LKSFFLVFVLAHLIGDFVFQTNRIAALKSKAIQGIGLHVLIVTLTQCILLSIFFGLFGLLPGLLVGGIHFFIDYMKKQLNPYIRKVQTAYFVFDQAIHIAIIYGVTYLMYVDQGRLVVHSQWLLIAIGIILCYFAGSIMVKFVLMDLHLTKKDAKFFIENERISDGMTALALYAVFGFPFIWIPGMLVFAPSYTLLQKKLFAYSTKTSVIKYVVLLLVAYGAYGIRLSQ